MQRGFLIRHTEPGWASRCFETLYPGGHAVVFGSYGDAIEAEIAGFEVRDCLVALGSTTYRIWLLRRPVAAPTVAAQVLSTETGGINVDGCRVTAATTGRRATTKGRWPANLVLVHLPGCVRVGTKQVRGSGKDSPDYATLGMRSSSYAQDAWTQTKLPRSTVSHADKDGLETVAAWDCAPGCPAAALDQQSGERPSIGGSPNISDAGRLQAPGWGTRQRAVFLGFEDTGGASRFYPQFANDAELDAWLLHLILGVEQASS